jgi:Smr domain
MKFSAGDKVVLKHTQEEGVIVAVMSPDMMEVDVRGITFPVYADDLEHPYLRWFTEKKPVSKPLPKETPAPEKNAKRRLPKGIYLSFLPVYKKDYFDDVIDYFKIFLLNETATDIKFGYDVKVDHKSVFGHEGGLQAFGNVYLHNMQYENMNDQPRFHWQLTDTQNKNMAIEDGILRIRPSKVSEYVQKMMEKNEPSFECLLIDDFKPQKPQPVPEKIVPEKKAAFYTLTGTNTHIEKPKHELDLHIEKLISEKKGLSNAAMLQLQLDTLEKYIYLAVMHRQEMMIVIHGLGKGTLREEVHKLLKTIPEVSRFKNEYSGKYGFGATEVWFRY